MPDTASSNRERMKEIVAGIKIPIHSTAAVIGKLVRYEETGDHNLYIMQVEKAFGDEAETPLFAWKGYAEVNTAVRGTQG